jgi:hypothetical protein
MSVYINSDLIDMDEQSVEQGEPSFCDDTDEVSRISRNIEFDWQRPQRKLTGRERYLALCQKLGLKPKEPRS